MENGIWRTVGGRRIFIRDGEDLATAMKKSGKFKSATKKPKIGDERDKKLDDYLDKYKDKTEGELRRVIHESNDETEKMAANKLLNDMKEEDKNIARSLKEKYMNIPEEERVKAYEEGKNWKDLVKEKDYSNTGLTEKEKAQVAESSKGANRELKAGEVKRQREDIEKASGLKVEKSFETDLYGNGKEDRFELEDGRIVSHTTEAFGKEMDKWSVSKYENGSMNSKNYDSYDDMIKDLKGGSDRGEIKETPRVKQVREENQKWRDSLNETNYSQKELDAVYKNEDYSEVISGLKNSELNKMKQAANDMNTTTPGTPGYKNARDYLQKMENKAAAQFLDRQKSVEKKVTSYNAYKNAFEEYKKKHPNSKITLNQFIKYSEGK